MTEEQIDSIIYSTGSERELLCETYFGKSFADISPILEYEMVITKIASHKWILTDIDTSMFSKDNMKIRLGIQYAYPQEQFACRYIKTYFDFYPWQLDDRFTDLVRDFIQKFSFMSSRKNSNIDDNGLVQLAKYIVSLGKERQ